MKKRKELDALLMTNMNGKKLGKGSGSGKEGHELLRNEASWDSNSTENDDFFSPPRKLTIRKPQRCRFCATSLQLCVFVVMVACIVVTGGLVWMHLDLKQDLDKLRLRIAKVESELETSKELASTVTTLESELETVKEQASTVTKLQTDVEKLRKLPAQMSSINSQIGYLNVTISQLQNRVKAVRDNIENVPNVDVKDLQQSVAQIGSTLQGVQSLQTQQTGQIETLTTSLQQLQTSVTGLQGDLDKLQQAASVPTPQTSDPTSDTRKPSGGLDVGTAIQSLQQEHERTSAEVTQLNINVVSLGHWKETLMPRIVALESRPYSSGPTDSALEEKVDQLQSQMNTLMSSNHSRTPASETGNQTTSPIGSDAPTDWRHDIESEIQAIQNRIDQLNPQNLNNNLLNPNITRGIQHQIERALSVFKEENLKSVDDLTQDNQAIWGRLYQEHSDIAELQEEVDALQVRVQDLENRTVQSVTPEQASRQKKDVTTAESSTQQMTSDRLQPVTIPGISTPQDAEMKFFIMDTDSDKFLTYSELEDFLGPTTPPKVQLMQFDKNQDEKLDLAEWKTALGFPEE